MKELLYITLGWLFGILSPQISDKIKRHYHKNDLRNAIISDLKNLAVRLAAVYGGIDGHLGTRSKESLFYVKTIYEKYGANCPPDIIDCIEKQINVPDDTFNASNAASKAKENRSLNLKKYSLSFLESVLGHMAILNIEFQREVLEIRSQLDIYNDQVENILFFYRLTFDPSCMGTNGDVIRVNLKNNHKEAQDRCKIIIDKICNTIEKSKG